MRYEFNEDAQLALMAIEGKLRIHLDDQSLAACTTLGELESLALRTMESQPISPDDEYTLSVLNEINESASANIGDPITPDDLDRDVFEIARTTKPGPTDSVYFAINMETGGGLPRIQLKRVSSVVAWVLFLSAAALSIAIGITLAWYLGCSSGFVSLLLLAYAVTKLPAQPRQETPTLREVIDQHHAELSKIRAQMPAADIKLIVRTQIQNILRGFGSNEQIDSDHDITWMWNDGSSAPDNKSR